VLGVLRSNYPGSRCSRRAVIARWRTEESFAFGVFPHMALMRPSSTGSLEGVPWPCLGLTKGESGELFFIWEKEFLP
jgi:hypothetical protein